MSPSLDREAVTRLSIAAEAVMSEVYGDAVATEPACDVILDGPYNVVRLVTNGLTRFIISTSPGWQSENSFAITFHRAQPENYVAVIYRESSGGEITTVPPTPYQTALLADSITKGLQS